MKKNAIVMVLCGAVMLGVATSGCLAFTMDDFKQVQQLVGSAETYGEGMALLGQMSLDSTFAAEHPTEAAWGYQFQARQLRDRDKNLIEAAARMKKAADIAPKGSDIAKEIMSELAWLYMETGQHDEAVATYKSLIAEYPQGHVPDWKLWASKICSWQGKYDEAIALSEEIVRDKPGTYHAGEALRVTAVCRYRLGQYEESATALRKLQTEYADSQAAQPAQSALDVITLLHFDQNAQDALLASVRERATRSVLSYARGYIESFTPESDDAIYAAYQKALAVCPDDKKLKTEVEYQCGNWCRAVQRHQQAIDAGQRLVADCKGLENETSLMVDAKMLIGYGYQCLGQYEKAIPVLKDVVQNLDPKMVGGWHNLASCYRLSGKIAEADALFDKLIANGPKTGMAQQALLEKALMRLGDPKKDEEAIGLYRQIFSVEIDDPSGDKSFEFVTALQAAHPDEPAVDRLLSGSDNMDLQTRKRMLSSIAVALRTKMNTPKQARDVYAVLASISQGEAKSEILFQMGDCDYAAGEWATGVADCRELYQTDPKGKFAARSKVLEASHLMQSGDYGGARKAFQEILADFPGSPDADVARLYIPMLSLSKQGGERQ